MTTAETIPAPLTEADTDWHYYGVHFLPLGEDTDVLMALGHVEPRRMLAAANRYCRVDGEYDQLHPDYRNDDLHEEVAHRYALRLTDCRESGTPDHSKYCGVCQSINEGGWAIQHLVEPSEPGAFPVTLLHV